MTVARSRAIDKLRIVRKERWQSEASVDEAVAMTFDPPADQATVDEQVQRIRAALYALDPKPRQALYLAYFGGMSQSEIARYLGIPLGTVKTHIRKALLQLRERLADLHAP
jgi:RNA polymerase sigma-70 factor (ECF subfamily)